MGDIMKIKLLNKIAQVGLAQFDENYSIGEDMNDEDGILVRSASLHEYEMNKNLLGIARAGAGVNNIPIEDCSEKGIVVFNTPGANANAVKELALCALFLASRKVVEGIDWVKTLEGQDDAGKLVEKGKSQFVGPEIEGKTLGVIGLGAIGVNVANAAIKLGMNVYGYDPYISVGAAWHMSKWVQEAKNIETILKECDYISLHAPSTKETKGMINAETIALMKDGAKLLNFARGDLVNTQDLLDAVESGKISKYITDFACKEIINKDNIIVMPHLGASTPESEDNCAKMAVKQLKDYLETGNITNSVNFPAVNEPRIAQYRICIIHKNVPTMLAKFATLFADDNINIENMINKAKGNYAYTIIETNDLIDEAELTAVENVIKVRILK